MSDSDDEQITEKNMSRTDGRQKTDKNKKNMSKTPNKIYRHRFCEKWLMRSDLKEWLDKYEDDDSKCFCKYCHCSFVAKIALIDRHMKTSKHKKNELNYYYTQSRSHLKYFNGFQSNDTTKTGKESVEKDTDTNSDPIKKNKFKSDLTLFVSNHCALRVVDHLPLLTSEERSRSLKPLLNNGWTIVDEKDAIQKHFTFANFIQTFGFITCVAMASEKNDHHPEWANKYNTVSIMWTTDASAGLTVKDLKMASFCDAAFKDYQLK